MNEELDWLRQVTEVPDAAVAELHRRVVMRTRRRWWPWVAAAAVPLLWFVPRPAPVQNLVLHPAAPRAPELPRAAEGTRSRAETRYRAATARERTPEPAALIYMETNDPDVVLYLIPSDGGGE